MKNRSFLPLLSVIALVPLLTLVGTGSATNKKSRASACTNPHPEQLCTAVNTCGAGGASCEVEIRRADGGTGASVKPNIGNFAKNSVICINAGTTVVWRGGGKNGIMTDFGDKSSFDPAGPIWGGSDRPVNYHCRSQGFFKNKNLS